MVYNFDAIPEQLKNEKRWVVWQEEKVPYCGGNAGKASSTNPETWCSFEEAVFSYQEGAYHGIGFMLGKSLIHEDVTYCGIDYDNHIKSDLGPTRFLGQNIKAIDSYTELSPSGNGVHTICIATKPGTLVKAYQDTNPDGTKQSVEIYDNSRYFTITGVVVNGQMVNVFSRQDELDTFYNLLFPPEQPPSYARQPSSGTYAEGEILAIAFKAKNRSKFEPLWRGDWVGYESHSEADLAFCNLLAFYTGKDVSMMDSLFRKSGLMRDKWDRKTGDTTYGAITLQKALDYTKEVYQPPKQKEQHTHEKKTTTRHTPEIRFTDGWNAKRFIADHGDNVRYIDDWGKWLTWGCARYEVDRKFAVHELAKQTIRKMYAEAADEPDQTERKALSKHAVKSDSNKSYTAMIALARSEPKIPVQADELDSNPMLLNVLNGTIDLQTGKIMSHNRRDLITKLAPVEYNPEAVCPFWLDSLRLYMRGNEDLIQFLQKAVGYSLTGEIREQVLLIAYGGGANGKSSFIEGILGMLGDYAQPSEPDLLIQRRHEGHPTGIADLMGKRFVSTTEISEGVRLNEGLVKRLTGSDTLKARFMRQDYFDFEPTHKLWIGVNHKPTIRGTDRAIWRRIRLIPFQVDLEKELSPNELLPMSIVLKKFRDEWPGILNWAINGCLRWQEEGLGIPSEVEAATKEYQQEMDIVGRFIEECCVEGEDLRVKAKTLYQTYKTWCEENGEYAISQKVFGGKLSDKNFERKRHTGNAHFWFGVDIFEGVASSVDSVTFSEPREDSDSTHYEFF